MKTNFLKINVPELDFSKEKCLWRQHSKENWQHSKFLKAIDNRQQSKKKVSGKKFSKEKAI